MKRPQLPATTLPDSLSDALYITTTVAGGRPVTWRRYYSTHTLTSFRRHHAVLARAKSRFPFPNDEIAIAMNEPLPPPHEALYSLSAKRLETVFHPRPVRIPVEWHDPATETQEREITLLADKVRRKATWTGTTYVAYPARWVANALRVNGIRAINVHAHDDLIRLDAHACNDVHVGASLLFRDAEGDASIRVSASALATAFELSPTGRVYIAAPDLPILIEHTDTIQLVLPVA